MKTRSGFVSNSSTSSFIVMYDGIKEETQKLVKELVEAAHKTKDSDDGFFMSTPEFITGGLIEGDKKWYMTTIKFRHDFKHHHPEVAKLFDEFMKIEHCIIEEFEI